MNVSHTHFHTMPPTQTALFSLNAYTPSQKNELALKRSVDECLDNVSFEISPSSTKRVHSSPEKNATLVDLFHHPYIVASTIALICHVDDSPATFDATIRHCYDKTRDYLAALSPSRINGEVIRTVLRLLYTPTNVVIPIVLQAAIGDLFIPFAFEPNCVELASVSIDKAVGLLVHDTLYDAHKRAFVLPWFSTDIVIDVPTWPFVMKRSNTMKSNFIGYWSCLTDGGIAFVLVYHPHSDDVSIVEAGEADGGVEYGRVPRRSLHDKLPTFFPTAFQV